MSFASTSRSADSYSSSASKKRSGPDPNSQNNRSGRVRVPKRASWGANSLSSSSTRKSPFTDFGSYMAEKNKKLRVQFDADASSSSLGASHDSGNVKGIFHGVSIFVDGFTVPPSQELRGYMLKYGGRFENYFSKKRVTHIICSHLPDSKMKNFRAFSRGLPVVKPSWVLESVAANKLLSWIPYQLDEVLNECRNQQKLSFFFTPKSISGFQDAETPVDPHVNHEFKDTLFEDNGSVHISLPEEGESSESKTLNIEEFACTGHELSCDGPNLEPKSIDLEDENSAVEACQSSTHRPLDEIDGCCISDQSRAVDMTCLGDSNQQHSTIGDPNFVENYFKNSRLHFIGTWRNRYNKRFLSKLNEVKGSDASVKPIIVSQRVVIHIDMDCFFVSVVVRNHPELLDKPVAICHSDNPKGTAEISSANYPAREYGIRAGMFVRDAKALCPHIVIFPYNFEAYEEVADQFYSILHRHCHKVQAVSCDEAFLDATELDNDPEHVALLIRQEIAETTRCTASAGIAGSLLLARLATRCAKPNGQCFIPSEKIDEFLKDLPIKALPGIGHALEEKLRNHHIQTCGQLCLISKESLKRDFGTKTGDMLWNYSRGVDNRMVEAVQVTKSVGAEVNWGIRFSNLNDQFLTNLCKEVSLRLQGCGMQGRTIMLKVKKRKKGAAEPVKYMGCGECDNMSRSMTIHVATDSSDLLQRITRQLFGSFQIDVKEIRGIGLHISKLENADMTRQGYGETKLESWLASSTSEQHKETDMPVVAEKSEDVPLPNRGCKPRCTISGNQNFDGSPSKHCIDDAGPSFASLTIPSKAGSYQASSLPPLCHLDIDVIKSLPPEIISEMNAMYDGMLADMMDKHEDGNDRINNALSLPLPEGNEMFLAPGFQKVGHVTLTDATGMNTKFAIPGPGGRNKGKWSLYSPAVSVCSIPAERKPVDEVFRHTDRSFRLASSDPENKEDMEGGRGSDTETELALDRIDLMPASLSQVDISILQQLPEELKVDIMELLPAHRTSERYNDRPISFKHGFKCDVGILDSENSKTHLWSGNPPKWIKNFKASKYLILNILAESYMKSGANCLLSSTLQSLLSLLPLSLESSIEGWDESLLSVSELLTQYIDLKIESDIEEIDFCFRLLKRLLDQSKFFIHVYNVLLPSLQTAVGEIYGGTLQLSIAKE